MEKNDQDSNMLSNIKEKTIIRIDSTPNYGYIHPDSKSFDDQELFGDSILNYKLFKVKIWYGKIEGIQCVTGIQTFYKDRSTDEILTPGEFRGEGVENDGVETITLKGDEYFVDFKVSINMRVANIELTTNKKTINKIGGETGEVKITPLNKMPNVVLATFGNYTNCLTAMGVYYMSRLMYIKALYSGYFYLRASLKIEAFKKEAIKNANQLSKENKAILKVCLLDDITFLSVMRFTIAG